MSELNLLKKENLDLRDSNAILKHKIALKQQENEALLQQLKICYDDNCKILNMLAELKKDLRRCEVQISSLKSENAAYKCRFAKIENNILGDFALKTYRTIREIKRRIIK